MKTNVMILTLIITFFGISRAAVENEKLLWTKTIHDFGTIEQATPVAADFAFTNNGEQSFSITAVKTSCGCTVADYTRGTIAPGEKGMVQATYNAEKAGAFRKSVQVFISTSAEPIMLTLTGEVQ